MNELQFRLAMFALAVIAVIVFLIVTASAMLAHPAVPWFAFGIVATLVVEAIIYGVYKVNRFFDRFRRWRP